MRSRLNHRPRIISGTVLLVMLAGAQGFAQEGTVEEGKRRVRTKTTAAYPDLARRMYVSGKVKLEAVVGPDGKVRSSRVLGGHPLLARAAQDAMKEWRFEPAAEESTVVVEFQFRLNEGQETTRK